MKTLFVIIFILGSNLMLFSQVAINSDGSISDSSAMLDVKSSLMLG